jgi:hypothetical protein
MTAEDRRKAARVLSASHPIHKTISLLLDMHIPHFFNPMYETQLFFLLFIPDSVLSMSNHILYLMTGKQCPKKLAKQKLRLHSVKQFLISSNRFV